MLLGGQVSIIRQENGDFELTSTKLAGYAPLAPLALEELMAGYTEAGAAYLDLQAMPLPARTGLINIGPSACLAGHISLVEGQLGAGYQVQRMPCLASHPAQVSPVPTQQSLGLRRAARSQTPRQMCKCQHGVTLATQVAFHIKEDQAQQLLQYEVVVGAYLQMDAPRQLSAEALTLLIPATLAEQARLHSIGGLHSPWHHPRSCRACQGLAVGCAWMDELQVKTKDGMQCGCLFRCST
jgi:hypothetical protein